MWLLYGQLVGHLISGGAIYNAVFLIWDSALKYVPAIMRLEDVYPFDLDLARLHATAMLISTPALFLLMLFANVEDSVREVRVRKKESSFILICLFVAGIYLLSDGSGSSGVGRIIRSSYESYALWSATSKYGVIYLLRLAFCVAFRK